MTDSRLEEIDEPPNTKQVAVWKNRLLRSLSFLSAPIFLVAAVFGIYSFLHKDKAIIRMEIISESNVLDVRKPLKDLKILFRDQDIELQNLNLKLITIRYSNSGPIDIAQNFFDRDLAWGVKILDGEIIETRLVDANSEYLLENLRPSIAQDSMSRAAGDSIITFNKIIFEAGKYFIIELLVLHHAEDSPEVTSVGKIMGIDFITPVRLSEELGGGGFWKRSFSGNFMTHVSRMLLYSIALIILAVGVRAIVAVIKATIWSIKLNKRLDMFESILGPLSQHNKKHLRIVLRKWRNEFVAHYLGRLLNVLENDNDPRKYPFTMDLEDYMARHLWEGLGVLASLENPSARKIEPSYIQKLRLLKENLAEMSEGKFVRYHRPPPYRHHK